MEISMTDIIVAVVLLLIIGSAVAYIIKAKKKGIKCIGCPHSSTCDKEKVCKSTLKK